MSDRVAAPFAEDLALIAVAPRFAGAEPIQQLPELVTLWPTDQRLLPISISYGGQQSLNVLLLPRDVVERTEYADHANKLGQRSDTHARAEVNTLLSARPTCK